MGDQGVPQIPPNPAARKKWILVGCCGCATLGGLMIALMAIMGIGIFAKATEPAAKIAREFLRCTSAGDINGAHATLNVGLQEALPPAKLKRMIDELPDRFRVKNVDNDITFDHREITKEMNIVVVLLMGTLRNEQGETRYCMFKAMQAAPGTWRLYAFNIAKEPISLEEVKKKG